MGRPKKSATRETLESIGAIESSRVERFADRTRDLEVPVLHDPVTGVIFIDDFFTGNETYEEGRYRLSGERVSYEDELDTNRRLADFLPLYFGKRVIDYGCGAGSFARRVKPMAGSIQAVELQQDLREGLCRDGIPCFEALEDCESADVVFMFHVLEHLPYPLDSLRKIRAILGPTNGVLVVEVPHARDFLISQAKHQPFIDFTLWSQHLVLHTRDSLYRVLKAAGFNDITIHGVQRYGLANHLSWLINGTPGGHRSELALMENSALRAEWSAVLAKMDATDTLVAVATSKS